MKTKLLGGKIGFFLGVKKKRGGWEEKSSSKKGCISIGPLGLNFS
jgi:hypothetical protein